MALSFHATTASLFGHHRLPAPDGMGFLQGDDDHGHSEVTEALLGFAYDPLDASNAALDELLGLTTPSDVSAGFLAPLDGASTGADDWRCGNKRPRIATGGASQQVPAITTGALINDDCVLQLAPPPPPAVPVSAPVLTPVQETLVFVRGADVNKAAAGVGGAVQTVRNMVAMQRRKRISEKTAELARLIPGAHRLNTAAMLEEAARHVKLLQAQVGVLALMRNAGSHKMQEEKMPSAMAAEERMHALLGCGSVQERLAAEGKCLVPTSLVAALAKDDAVKTNPVLRRDFGRFLASLRQGQ